MALLLVTISPKSNSVKFSFCRVYSKLVAVSRSLNSLFYVLSENLFYFTQLSCVKTTMITFSLYYMVFSLREVMFDRLYIHYRGPKSGRE